MNRRGFFALVAGMFLAPRAVRGLSPMIVTYAGPPVTIHPRAWCRLQDVQTGRYWTGRAWVEQACYVEQEP